MNDNYHPEDQNSLSSTGKEYYRVGEDTVSEGFTAEECYKITADTVHEGFIAEECYEIIEGPEQSDLLEDLDRAPEGEGVQRVSHQRVEKEVESYFRSLSVPNSSIRSNQPIRIGNDSGETDLDLYLKAKGKCIAIAEFKTGMNDANYGRRQLFSYLSATNTRFGIFANNLNRDGWIFYENLRHFRFRRIEHSQFEQEVNKGKYDLPDKHLISEDSREVLDQVLHAMESSQLQKSDVHASVVAYFSLILEQREWEYEKDKEIRINSTIVRTADFVLRGRDGSYIVIVEFRDSKSSPKSILDSLICATDAQFGIRAVGSNHEKWQFYERLGSDLPRKIDDVVDFTTKVIAQAKEAACPVFKGEVLSKERWNEYRKTWKNLKFEHAWRVTEVFHPDCPFTFGKKLSDADYRQAHNNYPGCPVKKEDVLTKVERDQYCQAWADLKLERIWHVTEVLHSGCSFAVEQYISHAEYEQAQVDYPGCSVKKGDILTKAEFTEHRKTWNNLKVQKIWCITDTNYQQAQQRIRDERDQSQSVIRFWQSIWSIATLECRQAQDERDKSQSKIKLWQFVTVSSGVFLLCFGLLFFRQRDATEDVAHQNAVLVNQLAQKESEIHQEDRVPQGLATSVQTLEDEKEALRFKISKLESQLRNRTFSTETTSKRVVSLRSQLNKQKDENQKLQNQLVKQDTEIQQLQDDKAIALSENRRLQSRLVEDGLGTTNQNATVQQLQSENQKLKDQNQDIDRQNRKLQDKNKALQTELDNAKQGGANQVEKLQSPPGDRRQRTVLPQTKDLVAEPPEKIQDYSEVIPRAGSHNNQGCLDFERNDYDEAVKQFQQAIKADSKFAIAHYNLGCAYLEIEEYSGAVGAFDRAITLDRKFKEAYYNRSFAYFRMSGFQEAKLDATKVLDIDPNYRFAQDLLTAIENAQQ